jgi:hypothetical protein
VASGCVAAEHFGVLVKVASGLMKEHSWLELKRAVFVAEGRKIGLLPHEIDKAAK